MNNPNRSPGWWVLCVGFVALGIGNLLHNPDLQWARGATGFDGCSPGFCPSNTEPHCCDSGYGPVTICIEDTDQPPAGCDCMQQ
jgi:hypothetical protein